MTQKKKIGIGIACLCFVFLIFYFYQNPYRISETMKLTKPSLEHILGTDHLGRDIFSRLLLGSLYSLAIAFLSITLATLLGSLLGTLAGYYGGYLDDFLLFVSESLMSIPAILITLGIIVLFKTGFYSITLAIFILYTPRTINFVRGLVKQEKHKSYIKMARIYGVGHFRIMLRHIGPNILIPILVNFSTNFAGAILTEASLGYLGFGIQVGDLSKNITDIDITEIAVPIISSSTMNFTEPSSLTSNGKTSTTFDPIC